MNARIVPRVTVWAVAVALAAGCASQQGNDALVGAGALGALGAAVGGAVAGAKGAAIGGAVGLATGGAAGGYWNDISSRLFGKAHNTTAQVTQQPDSVRVMVPINSCTRKKGCTLDASSSAVLAQVAQEMKANSTLIADISGFSDASGTQASNERVSLQRAQTVQSFLTRLGVAPDRIGSVAGKSDTSPIVDNNSPDAWKNRRAEIYLRSSGAGAAQPCTGAQCPQASE
ncbi:OmpA family protein [Trinickia sp.]|uniref:OmpA family protein n=1 Tax=Trinickia sp. TaxID=2571163 RepID=UPI003F7DB80D